MPGNLTRCNACRFWHGADQRSGVCRRHAPTADEAPFHVARWPETRASDGCGEGEPEATGGGVEYQACSSCLYWDRPGIGIDPTQRGDHLSSWWKQAGWCRRFAPSPGIEIGEHAFWRATHAEDACYDGHPR